MPSETRGQAHRFARGAFPAAPGAPNTKTHTHTAGLRRYPHGCTPRTPLFPCAVGMTYVHDRLHAQLYGEGVEPEEILGGRVAAPPELLPLYRDIDERASEARVSNALRVAGPAHGCARKPLRHGLVG